VTEVKMAFGDKDVIKMPRDGNHFLCRWLWLTKEKRLLDLATALADPVRATALARRTRVAHPPLHEWAGAAAWLAREQKAAVITLYQAAGLPDAAAARALTKRAVKARLRGAMSLVGATELPDKATRAAMRRA